MKKSALTLMAVAFTVALSANVTETVQVTKSDLERTKGLLAAPTATRVMKWKSGIKKPNGDYDCSVEGSECQMELTIITKDFVVPPFPVGFDPPVGMQVGKIVITNSDNPPTQWIPTFSNVEMVESNGTTEVINIPTQTAYYSAEIGGYLIYYSN